MPGSSVACQNCVNMIPDSPQLFQLGAEEGFNYTIIKHKFPDSINQGCPICLAIDSLACGKLYFCPANEAFRHPGSPWDSEPRNPNINIPDPGSTADLNQLLVINVFTSTLDAEHYDAYELWITTWSAENRDNFNDFFRVNAEADPAARYVSTRAINRDVTSPSSYELAKSWIHECMQGHQACPKTTIASLPSRVVDVGTQDDSEEPRVYISKGQKSSYAALSYYWGGPQSMVLTMSTVDSLMQGIDMSKLPQTIKDAIKSVRMLGLRYLWIDTLCIMQDSPQDMDLEIIKMDQYYENAHVTIAAGSASACTRGFLEYRPEFDLPLASIRYPCPDGASGNINIIKYDRYYPRFEPLNTRGWALQELALSSRVLTYGNWQLYWWCQNGLKCDGGSVSYFDQINIANLIPKKTVETDNKIEAPPIVESLLWKQWVNVVEEYSTRKLTLPRDKFPALSGIASRFATVSSDTYFAGLWKSRLLESLAWRVSDPSVRVEYEYCAPTWSWASSNRSVGFVGEGIIGKSSTGLFSQVIECVVELENPMVPFGKIKDASLKIRGIVKLIKWDGFFQIPMDGVDTSTLELSTRIGSPLFPDGIIAIAYPDYDEETVYVLNPSSPGTDTDMQDDQLWDEIQFYMSRDEVGLNQVTRSVTCLVLYNKHALILEKCTNGNYVRLGLMWFQSSTKLQEYFNGCEEMSLTIV